MMAFKVDNGQLQRKDINPSAGGFSTEDLTNPSTDNFLDEKQQVVSCRIPSNKAMNRKNLTIVFLLVGALLVVMGFHKNLIAAINAFLTVKKRQTN